MYDLPTRRDVKAFTITRELVEQRSRAKVVPIPGSQLEDNRDAQASA
jgi:ATP-dependent Clp protease ATP-binding subunit ClpX